jgi:hypothetical protein
MKHPCIDCQYRFSDKNGIQCVKCQKRIDYINGIDKNPGMDCKILSVSRIKELGLKSTRLCEKCGKGKEYARGLCAKCYNNELKRNFREKNKTKRCIICGKIGVRAMNMCAKHYDKDVEYRRRIGKLKHGKRGICKTKDCGNPTAAHGLCIKCYNRYANKLHKKILIAKEAADRLKQYARANRLSMRNVVEKLIELHL